MAGGFSYAQLKAALWARQGARVHALLDGRVVPPSQLDAMVEAFTARGLPHVAITFEGEALLGGVIQGVLEGCDSSIEGSAGQGRPTRAHLDEAGLADSGHPLVESDIVGQDPRDHWFQGSAAVSRGVVGGCDPEPLPQDLGLAPDDSIRAGKLALKESGVEGG